MIHMYVCATLICLQNGFSAITTPSYVPPVDKTMNINLGDILSKLKIKRGSSNVQLVKQIKHIMCSLLNDIKLIKMYCSELHIYII